jgi:hypothetical protein
MGTSVSPWWSGGNEAWRAQEPVNCHSHLLSMLLAGPSHLKKTIIIF